MHFSISSMWMVHKFFLHVGMFEWYVLFTLCGIYRQLSNIHENCVNKRLTKYYVCLRMSGRWCKIYVGISFRNVFFHCVDLLIVEVARREKLLISAIVAQEVLAKPSVRSIKWMDWHATANVFLRWLIRILDDCLLGGYVVSFVGVKHMCV